MAGAKKNPGGATPPTSKEYIFHFTELIIRNLTHGPRLTNIMSLETKALIFPIEYCMLQPIVKYRAYKQV